MTTVDVLVIGGGPVGLTAAALLGDLGVETLLVDRKPTTSSHPRAFGVHPRTMEVWRRLGVADDVRSVAVPPEHTAGIGWMTSLTGMEVGRLMFPPPPSVEVSPEPGCFCAQHRYEAVLHEAAQARAAVSVRFGCEVTAIQRPDAPRLTVVDSSTGVSEVVSARYVVAADGLASPVRQRLGVRERATGRFGHSVNVYFRADLAPLRKERPFALTWTVGPGAEGTFAVVAADLHEWTFNFEADPDHVYSEAELIAAVQRGVGDPGLAVEILDVLRWDYEQAVTDSWCVGRTFFCGDSAHRFPPHGGFGMNSGVQDAENLAWKLAAVLRWGAGESLLDTYETERKPVATYNSARALANTQALASAKWDAEHAQASVDAQVEHFFTLGQQMGTVYRSAAVIDDGQPVEQSTVTTYVESACPGARAPHVELRGADGRSISTIDLCRGRFVALVGAGAPIPDERRPASDGRPPIAWAAIGPTGDYRPIGRSWHDVYGVGDAGTVLVRPDGHVAARFAEPPSPATVAEVVQRLLGRLAG
ncbi:MAG: putative polyketide hydroxylase [Frankiaceae bacterium]|nr:putative polyketide hydroxylase [Frankiaceae bacterium]